MQTNPYENSNSTLKPPSSAWRPSLHSIGWALICCSWFLLQVSQYLAVTFPGEGDSQSFVTVAVGQLALCDLFVGTIVILFSPYKKQLTASERFKNRFTERSKLEEGKAEKE